MGRHLAVALSLALPALAAAACEQAPPAEPAEAPAATPSVTEQIATGAVKLQRVTEDFDYVFHPDEPMVPAYKRSLYKPALKGDQYDDIRAANPERYAVTEAPPAGTFRPMVEWEPMRAIVMAYPAYLSSSNYDNVTQTVVQIAKHSATVGEVWIHVESQSSASFLASEMAAAGMSQSTITSKVRFMVKSFDSIWYIDYGPLPLLKNDESSFAFADFRYYHERAIDDGLPTWLGRKLPDLGLPTPAVTYRMPLNTEGGTFQATTDGICFTGNRQLYYMSCDVGQCDSSIRFAPLSQIQTHPLALEVKKVWKEYAGCQDVIIMNSITDDGTGHIDMFMKVTDDNTVVMGQYETPYANSAQQQNGPRLDANAAFLEAYVKPDGTSFTVPRVVMPGHRSSSGGSVPFTYLNSTLFNGLNLWPATSYSDWVASRNKAQAQWDAILPTYDNIWIDSTTLSFWSGAIHCITRTIPDAAPGLWVGDGSCSGGTCQAPAGGYTGDCTPGSGSTPVCWGPEWLCACNDCDVCGGGSTNACGDVTTVGCCDGSVLYYCDNGQLGGGNCSGGCGWNPQQQWYDCGFSGSDPSGVNPKACGATCEPSCAGKQCGDDGCGGSCGACAAGSTCNASGQCVTQADPCGGLTFEGCCDGLTLKWCEGGEVKTDQCQQTCGWWDQQGYYVCGAQGADPSGQNPLSCDDLLCTPDCAGKACGDDGCGGSCGSCGAGATCSAAGQCVSTCTPQCSGKSCGGDGCGGSCGTCAAGESCVAGQCQAVCTPQCAGKTCGGDGCGGSCGTCGAGQTCTAAGQCATACVPSCAGKACGGDGCGGSCGTCGAGTFCSAAGQCEATCTPQCAGKACGGDGCGGSCGTCGAGLVCTTAGQCVDTCSPACAGKTCGDDGCGGSCGACAAGEACSEAGQCVVACTPSCAGKTCGDDGCGGSCGACGGGESCVKGACVPECTPSCAGKSCGGDGCGGSCGVCGDGAACEAGTCVAVDGCGDITFQGVCDGDVVTWCESDVLKSFDCATVGKVCGEKDGTGFTCVDAPSCAPACDGKQCGDDGCGGSCGSCPPGFTCGAGTCTDGTAPDATGTPDTADGPDAGPDAGPGEDTGGAGSDATGLDGAGTADGFVPFAGGGGSSSGCAGGGAPLSGGLPALLALLALAVLRRRAA